MACRCEATLREALDASIGDVFDLSPEQHMLTLNSQLASGSPAQELWAALELLGDLEGRMQHIAGDWAQ